ncbi:MAG: Ig-like domain-containing protein [Gemmatimonadota bacterium]
MRGSSLVYVVAAGVLVSCGGGTDSGVTNPGGGTTPVVSTVSVNVAASTIEVGSTTVGTAVVRDQTGKEMLGKAVTWSSSNTPIATVDAAGVIRGVAQGSTAITASVDGKSGAAALLVVQPAVATVTLSAPPASFQAGQVATLVATLKDKNGAVLTGRQISWTSSSTRRASVDANGAVTAISPGTSTITAMSEGISANVVVVVAAPPGTVAPTVSSITPATLTPGVAATINGSNFGAAITTNSVYILDKPATITSASPTQIKFTVPSDLPCQSTKPTVVEVNAPGGTAEVSQTLGTATQRSLSVGQSFLVASASSSACNELPSAGTYLVSVFNAGKLLNETAGFELKGAAGGPSASKIADAAPVFNVLAAPPRVVRTPDPEVAARTRAHLEHLQSELELTRRLGPPSQYRRQLTAAKAASGAAATASLNTPPLAIGALSVGANTPVSFHYNSCTLGSGSSKQVTARVVYSGPKAVVLEDNEGPLAGKIDGDMIALAKEFEEVSYPILTKNFGNPLAFDDSLSKNGKIIMFFTPQVNALGGVLGFVSGCDLYPSNVPGASASNQTEIFYAAAVTDTSPTSTSSFGRPTWKRLTSSTIIHETKHIISFGERFQTPVLITDFEETWLEEATAQMASELFGRALHGNTWKGNAGYNDVLFCELRPGIGSCGDGKIVQYDHFLWLAEFLQNLETKTILSGTDDNDIYGSSWLFTRWLTDTYGQNNEADFIMRMTLNWNVTGANNAVAMSGKTWPELLAQFSLMLAADDVANVPAVYQEASWDLPGIFSGINKDLKNPPPAVPLSMRQSNFGTNFTAGISSLKGGGAMLLKLTGAGGTATQLLDLHGPNGGALGGGSTIGITVLRIQ